MNEYQKANARVLLGSMTATMADIQKEVRALRRYRQQYESTGDIFSGGCHEAGMQPRCLDPYPYSPPLAPWSSTGAPVP